MQKGPKLTVVSTKTRAPSPMDELVKSFARSPVLINPETGEERILVVKS